MSKEQAGNSIVVTTSCQIPLSIKNDIIAEKRAAGTNNQSRLVRELLKAFLDKQEGPMSKVDLIVDKEDKLKYIPLLLPEGLRDGARRFALDSHISFGALVRHVLFLEFGTLADRKKTKKKASNS